jgi:hypothetical protein
MRRSAANILSLWRRDGREHSTRRTRRFRPRPTKVQVPPNLTPDPPTGRIAYWSETDFVERFRRGPTFEDTVMSWGAYRRMTNDDLRAVYRYLRSLPPVENDTGAVIQDK